jgi:hypothetical protein
MSGVQRIATAEQYRAFARGLLGGRRWKDASDVEVNLVDDGHEGSYGTVPDLTVRFSRVSPDPAPSGGSLIRRLAEMPLAVLLDAARTRPVGSFTERSCGRVDPHEAHVHGCVEDPRRCLGRGGFD